MEAVKWLHEKSIIHRDVKLENIMIAERNVSEKNKQTQKRGVLIDFGTTEHQTDKNLQSASFKRDVVLGTPGYYDVATYFAGNKEEKNKEILNPKTDIFAFAVILLEQRTNFNLDKAKENVTSKSKRNIEPQFKFIEQFEEYRAILLEHAKEEKNKELKQFFLIIFQSREDQNSMIQSKQAEEPTLKKLIEITRKLTK